MEKFPAFQFYPGDWLSCEKISMMPPACEGAYIRLLAYAWKSENCDLPADDESLAQLSRLGERWHTDGNKFVRPCFIEKNGRLQHERQIEDRKALEKFRKERSTSGLSGAKKRWLSHSSAIKEPMAKNGSSSSSSSSSSIREEYKNTPVTGRNQNLTHVTQCNANVTLSNDSPSTYTSSSLCSGEEDARGNPEADEFDKFWQVYPKKKSKFLTMEAWARNNPPRPPLAELLVKLEKQKRWKDWTKDGGQFIPNPDKYLSEGRWTDEETKTSPAQSSKPQRSGAIDCNER